MTEELMQQLRSKATEFLLREEWSDAIQVYSQFKTLVCKGKILLNLNRYSLALSCFTTAQLDPQANGSSVGLNEYLQRCKKLELTSKTGGFDLSEWVVIGFRATYIGAVEIRKSGIRGRGLFATKNMEAGSLVLISKAVATERGILPCHDLDENAQLVMWKTFTEKVLDSVAKCSRTCGLISTLSSGEDEDELEVPEINVFRPESEEIGCSSEKKVDASRILSILDVNSIVEDSISSMVFGKNSECWIVDTCFIYQPFMYSQCKACACWGLCGWFLLQEMSRPVRS